MKNDVTSEVDNLAHQIICLRNISRLFSQSEDFDQTLDILVHLIPEGWQYPSDTSVRILLDNYEVHTTNFVKTPWMLSAPIGSSEEPIGTIEIYYLEEKQQSHEGPFLEIERTLIDTIAVELGTYIERTQMERTKKQQHMELELYASLLRHDLRNDLGIVLANIDATRLLSNERSEIIDDLIRSSEAVCERMLKLLTVFGMSSNTVERRIVTLLRQVTQQAQEAHSVLKIRIIVDPDDEELKVPASKLLPLVFDNLLRNAVAHAGDHPIVEIEITRCENNAQIIISDNGPGITLEIKEQLFSKGTSTKKGGGLGLYLSRNVIEAMDGTIDLIESKKGAGATFRILLPMVY